MKINSLLICIALFKLATTAIKAQETSEAKWSMSAIEIKNIPAQNALVMKTEADMASVGVKMGEVYPALFEYMGANGIQPAGPAFAVYYKWDMEKNLVVFESGVPVGAKCESTETIKYSEFPAMKAVTTTYTGAYENLEGVYKKLMAYMGENSIESTGISWEVYLTDPNTTEDPNMNQTQIYFPVKE